MAKAIITADPGTLEILITREFDAPREIVFKAHIDPELIRNGLDHANLTQP